MHRSIFVAVFTIIALCLVKLAFFSTSNAPRDLIPGAYADGSIIEWKGSSRIVTTSGDGTTTYVWDYDSKTAVRKYWIEGDSLHMKNFSLSEKK